MLCILSKKKTNMETRTILNKRNIKGTVLNIKMVILNWYMNIVENHISWVLQYFLTIVKDLYI